MFNSAAVMLSAIPAANIVSRTIANTTSFTQNAFANLFANPSDVEADHLALTSEASENANSSEPDPQFLAGPANRIFAAIRISSKTDSRGGKSLGADADKLVEDLKQFLSETGADDKSSIELLFNGTSNNPTVQGDEPLATRVKHWLADRQATLEIE